MFDLEINDPDSPLINLKIYKVSKFGKDIRSTVKIHFSGWEKS
jgi:hypothetical protein